jgi:predicted kinase
MACETLANFKSWRELSARDRSILLMATLMHDIGKPSCTKIEDGRITSPKHAIKGAQLARTILWQQFGWAGDLERLKMREEIVSLIRLHSIPYRFWDKPNPLVSLAHASILLRCILLAMLSEADVCGRIADNRDEAESTVAMFRQYAEENDCLEKPFSFKSDHSRYAYFSGILEYPSQDVYDDTWGEVIIMSGLPASGKDTYINKHLSHLPVISLDRLRQTMNVSWLDDQSPVVATAREKAKEYLRKREPFILNATNLTVQMRQMWIKLLRSYNARVRIVYVEAPLDTLLARNRKRENPVNESAIIKMFDKLELPTLTETHSVNYSCG